MTPFARSSYVFARYMQPLRVGLCFLACVAVSTGLGSHRPAVEPHAPEAVLPSVVKRKDSPPSSRVLVDSRGSFSIRGIHGASQEVGSHRTAAGLLRRQADGQPGPEAAPPADAGARRARWWGLQASLLAEGEVGARAEGSRRDLYVLIGSNLCDGGGLWKRYELNAVTPGKYEFCAAACDAKDECVGFDVGNTGCNLYTQKAVAIGTWQLVRFNNGEAFAGEGAHDAYPQTPLDLTVGNTDFGANENFQCYRKTYYKPPDSYFWLIGNGTCSGGGLWKRYELSPGNYSACENACNLRDECIGFDVGTWSSPGSTMQVHKDNHTTPSTSTGCFLYTQKALFGTWPGVGIASPQSGEGEHDAFPATPFDLSVGSHASYNVGNQTQCFGKTHWVSLKSYYYPLGKNLCSGGGLWKHYKTTGGSVADCQDKCDMQDSCVGLDFTKGGDCRLYTSAEVAGGSWAGVTFDGAGAFSGSGDHDSFPPSPFSLVPEFGDAEDGKHCFARTHYEA